MNLKAKYYIESVEADGPSVEKTIIKFGKGLNIITGESDTGKTSIVRSILYIFDKAWKKSSRKKGEEFFPFSSKFGYDKITVVFNSCEGKVSLARKIGNNYVDVNSTVEEIKSDRYSVNRTTSTNLNDILLKFMGINKRILIPKNSSYRSQRLTWKSIANLWYIDEETVTQSSPKMLPDQFTEITGFLSALNYLVTGKEIEIPQKVADPKVEKARNEAKKVLLRDQIKNSSEQAKLLEEKLSHFDGQNIDEKLDEVAKEIESLNVIIAERMNRLRTLQRDISNDEQKIQEMDIFISRYDNLQSEYIADIKRLSFIVNGEKEIGTIPVVHECPFCHQNLKPEQTHSHKKAAKSELTRIMTQLRSLEESTRDVAAKKEELTRNRRANISELKEVQSEMRGEYEPKLKNLRQKQSEYQEYMRVTAQLALYRQLAEEWNGSISEIEKEDTKKPEYHPLEHFPDTFSDDIARNVKHILEYCSYPNLLSVRFDLEKFEIEINGDFKDETHGKGFRAFLNTVVHLAFRQYLYEQGAYTPGIDIIDTPFLGLDLGDNENSANGLKAGLVNYLASSQEFGQLIVVENRDSMPDLNLDNKNVNLIEFSGDDEGRQGFLNLKE